MKKTEIKKKNIIGIRIIAAIMMLILVSSAFVFAADENAVKCRSGVLVTPIGDLEAEAPELAARSAAMYSLDMERFVYEKDADIVIMDSEFNVTGVYVRGKQFV